MKEHILLEKAHRYLVPKQNLIPKDCTYDIKKGYWVIDATKEIMMLSDDKFPGIITKKQDRETGEDQKGE